MHLIRISHYFLMVICATLLCCVSNDENQTIKSDLQEAYYGEKHRNQFHFSPEANWMNDPNGMVYYEGEYHLYYQYYPDSTVWGPMHWGHAVSKDLVHWEHLPIALYPDSIGYIFSGSAVIDWENTSGFGENGRPPMIAIFTYHDIDAERAGVTNTFQTQAIAYSNDRGRTFTKFVGNPVVPNPGIKDFRDPKVIWDDARDQWVMVFAAYNKVLFYTSPNLIQWTSAGSFGIDGDQRLWECPDLFPMKVEETGEEKWVLITSIQKDAPNGGTATSYFVGDFDGKTFIGDPEKQYWLDYGKDNYAMVTWSGGAEADGRTLALGWMSNWQYAQVVPTEKWRSAMTLPRTLTLHQESDRFRIRTLPVAELDQLNNQLHALESGDFTTDQLLLQSHGNGLYKIDLTLAKPSSSTVGIRLSNDIGESLNIGYDGVAANYFIDRSSAGQVNFQKDFTGRHEGIVDYEHEQLDLIIYLDHASVELFADDGKLAMTDIFFASKPFNRIEIISTKGEGQIIEGRVTELDNIWR